MIILEKQRQQGKELAALLHMLIAGPGYVLSIRHLAFTAIDMLWIGPHLNTQGYCLVLLVIVFYSVICCICCIVRFRK